MFSNGYPSAPDQIHSPTGDRHHFGVELADSKAKLRRTRQELEEKLELLGDYKNELIEKDALLAKLRQENLELLKDARQAKTYRDEADILREKASKVDRLETECERFKEKLTEMEFYKSRVEELRSENYVLLETRHLLEDQVESGRRRSEQTVQAETQLLHVQKTVQQLQEELKTERELVAELMEQNSTLEQEHRNVLQKAALLEHEVDESDVITNGVSSNGGISLSDQLSDSVHSKLLQLELENKNLKSGQMDAASTKDLRIAELQSEIDRLTKKLDFVQQQNMRGSTMCLDLQDGNVELNRQNAALEAKVTSMDLDHKRELEKVTLEKSRLLEEISDIRDSLTPLKCLPPGLDLRQCVHHLASDNEALTGKIVELNGELTRYRDSLNPRLTSELDQFKTRLTSIEKEKFEQESKAHVFERDLKYMEKENANLKQLLEVADADFEKHKSQISNLERENQRLEMQSRTADETSSRLTDVQLEKRQLSQQLELESKKRSALREDLIKEKTRCQIFETQVHTIVTSMGISTSSEQPPNDEVPSWDTRIQEQLVSMKATYKTQIDGLESRLRQAERDYNRVKDEYDEFKRKTNQEKKRHEEQLRSGGEQAQAEIRNQLDSLEHENKALSTENRNVKEQVYLLQEQVRRAQTQAQSLAAENAGVKQELAEHRAQENSVGKMRTENAQLQVDLRHMQLQLNVLEADNIELQKQNACLDAEFAKLSRSYEHIQRLNADLSSDHELLQNHHLTLNRDFERICNELTEAKTSSKQMSLDYHSQKEQFDLLAREHDVVKRNLGRLQSEKESWERDLRALANLQSDHGALRRAHDDLRARMEEVQERLKQLLNENRGLKTELSSAGYRSAQIQGQISDLQERIHEKDLDIVKLEHKCEMFQQLGATLEDENRTLLRQMDMIVTQNKDLFHQALTDKDNFHQEEKDLQEKLNSIRRQKEKLEEKIMEQYKTMSPTKGKRSTSLMKRAKAFITRADSRRAQPSRSSTGNTAGNESMDAASSDEGGTLPNHGTMGFFSLRRAASTEDLCSTSFRAILDRLLLEDPNAAFSDTEAVPAATSFSTDTRRGQEAYFASNDDSSSSSGPPTRDENALRQKNVLLADRISLTGSERGVDVPECSDDSSTLISRSLPYAGSVPTSSASPEYRGAMAPQGPQRHPPPPYRPPNKPIHDRGMNGTHSAGSQQQHPGQQPVSPPPIYPRGMRTAQNNFHPSPVGPPIVVTFANSNVPQSYQPRIPLRHGQVLAKSIRTPSCPPRIAIHKPILPPYPGASRAILKPANTAGAHGSPMRRQQSVPQPLSSSTPKQHHSLPRSSTGPSPSQATPAMKCSSGSNLQKVMAEYEKRHIQGTQLPTGQNVSYAAEFPTDTITARYQGGIRSSVTSSTDSGPSRRPQAANHVNGRTLTNGSLSSGPKSQTMPSQLRYENDGVIYANAQPVQIRSQANCNQDSGSQGSLSPPQPASVHPNRQSVYENVTQTPPVQLVNQESPVTINSAGQITVPAPESETAPGDHSLLASEDSSCPSSQSRPDPNIDASLWYEYGCV